MTFEEALMICVLIVYVPMIPLMLFSLFYILPMKEKDWQIRRILRSAEFDL